MVEIFPGEPDWEIQTLRVIAEAAYGGADAFECFRTATKIKLGDFDSWHEEWHALARELEASGRSTLAAGNTVSARQQLFRASNYYRHADFFRPGFDAVKRENFIKTVTCFKDAIKLHDRKIETVQVTCGSEVYDGYFCHPVAPGPGKWRAVLWLGGADSLAEENYFFGASEIAERGVAVLILDTPGRGSSLRLKNIPSRPDYEVPVKAAIDYLSARPEIDPERIGCVGVSLGGYYAPRGTAFEPRIKALLTWCACYDVLEELYDWYPPIQAQMRWILGVSTDAEARAALAAFNLKGIAERITCPTLISHGVQDMVISVNGAHRLYDAIGSKDKQLKIWSGAEGGAIHCNYDNWAASIPYMIDWLVAKL